MLISANERNSSDSASEAANIPATEKYSRSGKRGTSCAGPTLAIHPSKVTRSAPLAAGAFPKIKARGPLPSPSPVSCAGSENFGDGIAEGEIEPTATAAAAPARAPAN